MAIAVSTGSTVVTDSSGDMTLNEPSGAAEGDWLVACIGYRSNAAFSSATWTQIQVQNSGDTDSSAGIASGVMFYIQRGASAPSYVFTRTAGDIAMGTVLRVTGAHASAPLDTSNSVTDASAADGVVTMTGFNTAEANEVIIAMLVAGDGTGSLTSIVATDPAAGWTEVFDDETVTGADVGLGVRWAPKSSAGATGDFVGTYSLASRAVLIAAAFKPAAAATGQPTSKRFGGVPFMAFPGRGNVWAPQMLQAGMSNG